MKKIKRVRIVTDSPEFGRTVLEARPNGIDGLRYMHDQWYSLLGAVDGCRAMGRSGSGKYIMLEIERGGK